MADATEDNSSLLNGIEVPNIVIKPDPDSIDVFPPDNNFDESADVELRYFTQDDLNCIKKCMDNMKLIIKDYETQLDWHLQQYMTLRNIATREGRQTSRDDLDYLTKKGILTLSTLNTMMNKPDGNRSFGKRKASSKNGSGKRRRQTSSDESDDSEYDSELDEEYGEINGESDEDDPLGKKPARKTNRKSVGKRAKSTAKVEIKDEIEEEYNELIVPKDEPASEEEPLAATTTSKRGRKKATTKATPKKNAKKTVETIDLTNLKTCSVVLKRVDDEEDDENVTE